MKLVIFDCDGTIADSQHMISAAMDKAFQDHDLKPPGREGILSVVGLSLDIAIARLCDANTQRANTVTTDAIPAIAESYRRAFAKLRTDPAQTEPLFEGAKSTITHLNARDDVILGIATGKSFRGLTRLLDRENLRDQFVTLQTADDHPSKPHPSMVRAAMAETGIAPHDTVMIGDTTFDIDMARAAGVGAVAVTWGYHPASELEYAGAHVLVERYEDLVGAIDNVLQGRAEAAA